MILEVVSRSEFLEMKQMLLEFMERFPKNVTVNKKDFLTAKEVKEILQCSDGTLRNYRIHGILSAQKIGGRFYYAQSDVNNLLTGKSGGYNGK